MSTIGAFHLSITNLFTRLKKSTNEETAITITQAFEEFREEQKSETRANKKAILTEINLKDLATKEDLTKAISHMTTKMEHLATKEELAHLEIKIYQYITHTKWQVIGTTTFFFFSAIVAKYLGLL
jgi:hypothetical protein